MAQGLHLLNTCTIIFKYVYWYMKQISGERLQDHWSSGLFNVVLNVHSIKHRLFSLIRIYVNVVYRVERSYVDKLITRNTLHFHLLSTSSEFVM